MATRTKPLIASAALATAAAVVVATPAVVPSAAAPVPPALASAQVQLATFSDLLSITPEDWNNVLFDGWGFALQPDQIADFDWANAFLTPFCSDASQALGECTVNGPSGIAYLALDALINGNGQGIETVNGVLEDPDKPYQPDPDKPDYNPYVIQPWSISAVNYFFEAGPGPGITYLALQPFGNPASPLYNPALATALSVAAQGLPALTVLLIAGLDTVSKLARETLPFVGPYIYGAIQAALGPNSSDDAFGDWGYFAGLSGVLRYVTDVILTGGNPYPPYGPPVTEPAESAASTLVSAAAVSADAGLEAPAESAGAESADTTDATDTAAGSEAAPAVEAEAAPVAAVAEAAPAVEVAEVAEVAEVEAAPAVEAEAVPAVEVAEVETAPAAEVDITPADVKSSAKDAPAATASEDTGSGAAAAGDSTEASAAEAVAEAPAKATNRAKRGALQRAAKSATKSIGSALKGALGGAASAEKADAS